MKKTSLLVLAALSFFGVASADEYWVIKDGVVNENISQMGYEADAVHDTLISSQTAPDQSVAAAFLHNSKTYQDVRFDLSQAPLDLTKAWVLKIEYMLPSVVSTTSTTTKKMKTGSLLDGTKPAFIMGLDGEMKDAIDVTGADAMFTIQAAYQAQTTGDQWTVREQYVFINPAITQASVFVLSYCREIATDLSEEPAYIKNLSFVSVSKPFYAEDFTPIAAPVYADASLEEYTADKLHGGILPTNSLEMMVQAARLWDKPFDNSKMYDAENYLALFIAKYDASDADATGYTTKISDIEIPSGSTEFTAAMLIKERYMEAEEDAWAVATDEQRVIPIYISFDNATDPVALFPADSLLQGQWTWDSVKVVVPAGAKTCTLTFEPGDFSYAVDQIRLGNSISVSAPDFSADEVESQIYFDGESNSVVAVGATKVEVLSLSGVVLASANGGSVNASGLANGAYIVRAFSANGVTAKTIIKK